MIRVVLVILLSIEVKSSTSSVQSQVYVSRKSRSNGPPLQSGYIYSKINSDPGTLATFDSSGSHEYTTLSTVPYIPSMSKVSTISEMDLKHQTKFLPSKHETDAKYERLKSFMYYNPSAEEMMNSFKTMDFDIDSEDVRTTSRNYYDTWPYLVYNPFEYDYLKVDSPESMIDKAKEKRYAYNDASVRPVYEHIDDDRHTHSYGATLPTPIHASGDLPLVGETPFYSLIRNDYSDKNNDDNSDDSFSFNGLEWENSFDSHDIESTTSVYPKAIYTTPVVKYPSYHRPPNSYYHSKNAIAPINIWPHDDYHNTDTDSLSQTNSYGESVTEKYHKKKKDFDKFEKDRQEKSNDKSKYRHALNKYNGHKDIIESLANRYGTEDHSKDSDYIIKNLKDKAEKKKGFHRVYHKDEYQMDKEFYDNSENLAKLHEKGNLKFHNGGSEASLESHAAAAAGDEANAFEKSGSLDTRGYHNRHKGYDTSNDLEKDLIHYRNIANDAAISNRVY